ncbi:MAG: MBL fold metallo-hydrolase [Longimicrobiales bacterium]
MHPSRRRFLATSAAAAAGALFRPVTGWGFPSPFVPRDFTSIRRNVGFFTMRGGTIGYLVNDGGVAVVDSQYPEQAGVCIDGLNERSGGRPVDALINTHHHGDHTAGNVAFRGVARQVVAHRQAAEHMRNPPVGTPPDDQLYPTATFDDAWSLDLGDERIHARYRGRAHTGGDAVVTFERANVTHMGDLMFHVLHPVVDRAAGATMRGWMDVLQATVDAHDADTIYIFGHAGADHPVTGGADALLRFRDYLGAVLAFVEEQVNAGLGPTEILELRGPLTGFEEYGPFRDSNPRDALDVAVAEVTGAG